MADFIALADHRPPTRYTIRIAHHWDGTLEFFVEDVPNDERTRQAIVWALKQAVVAFSDPSNKTE